MITEKKKDLKMKKMRQFLLIFNMKSVRQQILYRHNIRYKDRN